MTRDELFTKEANAFGYSFDSEIKIGGNYEPRILVFVQSA